MCSIASLVASSSLSPSLSGSFTFNQDPKSKKSAATFGFVQKGQIKIAAFEARFCIPKFALWPRDLSHNGQLLDNNLRGALDPLALFRQGT